MSKRITVVVDDEVAASLDLLGGRSVSSTVNGILREAIATARHQAAVLQWLDDLDEQFGPLSQDELDQADLILDELGVSGSDRTAAA
jgi:predicted transcriptional regulator